MIEKDDICPLGKLRHSYKYNLHIYDLVYKFVSVRLLTIFHFISYKCVIRCFIPIHISRGAEAGGILSVNTPYFLDLFKIFSIFYGQSSRFRKSETVTQFNYYI